MTSEHDLANDLLDSKEIMEKVKQDYYAKALYAAMCNQNWKHKESRKEGWGCGWRAAGGIIALLRNKSFGKNGDVWNLPRSGEERDGDYEIYNDFYCSGNEGFVDDEIANDLLKLGWEPIKEMENE
jgi:hypothetical protein